MNILQRIINTKPKSTINDTDPVFSEDQYLGNPVYMSYFNPSTEKFLTGVPQEPINVSFSDYCNKLYEKWLKFEYVVSNVWDALKYMFVYRKDIKCAKELAKMHEEKKKLFISHQVKAMVGHIIDFNTENTCWKAEGKDKILCFRTFHNHHHKHDMIVNRNISRHWNKNVEQSVIS